MESVEQDRWVPTVCYMCYSHCNIEARRVKGLVVDIRGNPVSPQAAGKLCAKGKAALMGLYDPYRIKRPLRRTNPLKGKGIDPGWVEISWEEALEEVVARLKEIKEEDPRQLVEVGFDFQLHFLKGIFAAAFGTPNSITGPAGYFCGPALHLVHYLMEGAFYVEIDFAHCNYALLVGSQMGFMVNNNSLILARKMAEARERGMRLVVVDPMCGVAASKADEWIPIRPGTDAAFALSMLNVLLNELGIFDAEFLKKHTNGPYLVSGDGYYKREAKTGKPLIWDPVDNCPKAYDSSGMKGHALEGDFMVEGQSCRPAFELLKEHVKGYPPERAAEITTIPANTIRRLATEFGQAARIGSHIVIEGTELPYRPATVHWTRGAGAHAHGGMAGLALNLLNVVVGAIDVPGGILGNRTITHLGGPRMGPDGLIVPNEFAMISDHPYPARKVAPPKTVNLMELFPVAHGVQPLWEEGILNPKKYGLALEPKMILHLNSNLMMTTSSPKRMEEVLKQAPFMVSFSTWPNETTELADVVLPDSHFLERLIPFPNCRTDGEAMAAGCWYWPIQQPVVEPPKEARPWAEVILEIAHQLGILPDMLMMLNTKFRFKEPFRLDPGKKHSWEEIADLLAKSWFGPEHDLEWFKTNGLFIYEKKLEERYPRIFLTPRIPIYFEHYQHAAEDLEKVTQELGLQWDTSDFRPLVVWLPCPDHDDPNFQLFAVNYRLPFHTFSTTAQNPWLNELGEHHPYAYKILINSEVARKKGIGEGELIWVESSHGRVKGKAGPTECIHPEVVAIAGCFGHWAEGMPVARGKGTHFNSLLPSGLDRVDKLCAALDACVRVKVYKD